MKRTCIFLFSAAIAAMTAFAGCEKIENPSEEDKKEPDKDTPAIPEDLRPKIELTAILPEFTYQDDVQDAPVLPNPMWSKIDQIVAVGFNKKNSCIGMSLLSLKSGFGTAKGIFSGPEITGAANYRFFYYVKNIFINQQGVAQFVYLNQTYNSNTISQLKPYLHLQSEIIAKSELKNKAEVAMEMQNAIMVFEIQGMKSSVKTASSITWKSNCDTKDVRALPLAIPRKTVIGDAPYFCIAFNPENFRQLPGTGKSVEFQGGMKYNACKKATSGEDYRKGICYHEIISTEYNPNTLSKWKVNLGPDQILLKTVENKKITIENLPPEKQSFVKSISKTMNEEGFWLVEAQSAITEVPADFFMETDSEAAAGHWIEEIILPEGVLKIGKDAFNKCMFMKSITLPESLTEIDTMGFACCNALKEIILPDNVTKMETGCFSNCKTLAKVVLPAKLETIPESAFNSCGELTEVRVPENSKLVNIRNVAFTNAAKLTEIPNMEKLKSIGGVCFKGSGIKNVVLNDNSSVGSYAFEESAVETLTVKEISIANFQVFNNCRNMKKVTVLANPGNESLRNIIDNIKEDYSDIELYLNQTWKDGGIDKPTGNKWMYKTWKSITYTDAKGNPLPNN